MDGDATQTNEIEHAARKPSLSAGYDTDGALSKTTTSTQSDKQPCAWEVPSATLRSAPACTSLWTQLVPSNGWQKSRGMGRLVPSLRYESCAFIKAASQKLGAPATGS